MSTLERGFTLPEVMLALTFGSLLALAAAKTYPLLCQQSVAVGSTIGWSCCCGNWRSPWKKICAAPGFAPGGRC